MKWNIYIHTWIRGVYNAPRSWYTFIVIYLKLSKFSWLKCMFPFNMSRSTVACIPVTIIKLQWRFYYMYPWNGLVTNISWHLTYLAHVLKQSKTRGGRKYADCHGFVCGLAGCRLFFFLYGSSGLRREIHQFHSVLSLYMRGPVRVLRGGAFFGLRGGNLFLRLHNSSMEFSKGGDENKISQQAHLVVS